MKKEVHKQVHKNKNMMSLHIFVVDSFGFLSLDLEALLCLLLGL